MHIFADVLKFHLNESRWQELQCLTVKPDSADRQNLIKLINRDDYDFLPKLKLRFGHTASIYK